LTACGTAASGWRKVTETHSRPSIKAQGTRHSTVPISRNAKSPTSLPLTSTDRCCTGTFSGHTKGPSSSSIR
jgi:hypothetical protein